MINTIPVRTRTDTILVHIGVPDVSMMVSAECRRNPEIAEKKNYLVPGGTDLVSCISTGLFYFMYR